MGLFTSKLDDMTSSQLQRYAMKYAEENNMSDAAAAKLFGPKIKEKQAEEAKGNTKRAKKDAAAKRTMTKAEGKTKMMRGGMANKKEHFYVAGGAVTDNAGLRALKAASPEAYNKITGK